MVYLKALGLVLSKSILGIFIFAFLFSLGGFFQYFLFPNAVIGAISLKEIGLLVTVGANVILAITIGIAILLVAFPWHIRNELRILKAWGR